jgi:phosphatidylserine/phosphatidylglycerophosphate/cardiolipin synthase-like enzyme
VIEQASIGFFDRVPKGGTIRIAMYEFRSTPILNALKRASNRGVLIKAAVDGVVDDSDKYYHEEIKKLDGNNINVNGDTKGNEIVLCDKNVVDKEGIPKKVGACIGEGINHNKFFLIDKICKFGLTSNNNCRTPPGISLDDSIFYNDIVLQSTHNYTGTERPKHNVALAFFTRPDLYNYYKVYHHDLLDYGARGASNLNYNKSAALNGANSFVKVHLFPNSAEDAVLDSLNKVYCKQTSLSSIRIAIAHMSGTRSRVIIEKLKQLNAEGCLISIILSSSISIGGDYENAAKELEKLRKLGVKISTYPSEGYGDIHAKYILIDAPYGIGSNENSPNQKVVSFGSHNLNTPSQTLNDETWITLTKPSDSTDQVVYNIFKKSFEALETAIQTQLVR